MTEEYIETRLISLNSLYATKINGDYLSNVEFNFKDILTDAPNTSRATIQLINAMIPASYYCINYTNDILTLNGVNITITRGNYNSSSLITELINKIFASTGITYTITISRITGKMSFVNSNTFNIYGNGLGVIMGFTAGVTQTAVLTGLLYQLNPPYSLNLLGIKKIKIFSNALATHSFDSFQKSQSNIINTIPINSAPFGLIMYNQPTSPLLLRVKTINTIDIQLFDENNLYINFNNISWSMTLQLEIVKIRQSLVKVPNTLTDVLEQELEKIDEDIKTLANGSDSLANPTSNEEPINYQQDNQNIFQNDLASDLDILQG